METMHSKLIRLQTALLTLALLFTVLVPVSAFAEGEPTEAQGTANSETISDPNTFNAWVYTQAYNNATTGRIWADKTVEENKITFTGDLADKGPIAVPKGADFLVALSALSSHASTTTTDTKPLDVVLVLDASGSMDETMGNGDNTTRIDALREAVGDFIDSTAEKNKGIADENKKIRLSIVKFAGDSSYTIGNGTYSDGWYTYNYSQIMQGLTVCEGDNVKKLQDKVDSIDPAGATRADNGMKRAQAALESARENAKKVVIFFTDGTPTSLRDFSSSVASSAITTAKEIKAAGGEIYTVGIFSGADPAASVTDEETSRENKFMHAVSSNYPQATYTEELDGYSWNFGTKAANASYYLAASSAAGLNKVFDDIFKSVTNNLAGPTEVVGDNPTNSGYVTFDDPLGDYMEVKDFEAVAFAGGVYKNKTKSTNGNVDTYTFANEYTGTASNAYPHTANLSHILITVTRGSGSAGDTVKVKIPASMLPLRYYQVTTDKDNKSTLAVTNTQPISVIYSVGLKQTVRDQITSGNIDDALASYVAANTEDGKVSFYSNKFDPTKKTADGSEKTIGSTTATFTPATSNSFYYHTEDAPLFTKIGEGEDAKYEPVTDFKPKTTYYYKLNYLHLDPPAHTKTVSKTDMVPMHIDDSDEVRKCIDKTDGKCYIKKGTKKGSLPAAIDSQLGDKSDETGTGTVDGNLTGTADRRIDFQWNLTTHRGVLYLGNNGKLTMDATGSVKVTKVVEADEGLTPSADTDFTMKFELAGTGVDANAAYKYTVTNKEGAVQRSDTIKNNGEFTLKNGEIAEIKGLPVGSNYTITEEKLPAGYRQTSITGDGKGKVTAGTAQEVTVTNTYEPEGITVDPNPNNYPFNAEKILKGRDWRGSDIFTFQLQAVTTDAPLPAGETVAPNGTHYTEYKVTGKTDTNGTPVDFNFGSVTFKKPGTYVYDITEIIPTDKIPTDKIPGVSYDSSFYRVTVNIKDDGKGQLAVESSSMVKMLGNKVVSTNETTATFTNTFKDDTEELAIQATKIYTDSDNKPMQLPADPFHFELEAATVNERNEKLTDTTNIPMPSNAESTDNNMLGEITFADITYTLEKDNGKIYYYLLTEVRGSNADTITYSTEKYLIKVEVSADTTDATTDATAGELLKVTPTYYRWNGTGWENVSAAKVTFTNKFKGTTTATLGVSKSISGRNYWNQGEQFTFALEAKDNAPMPTNAGGATATASESNKAPDFGPITYTKAGIYNYTIKETSKPTNGMANAEDVTATVTVTLNAESNKLEAKVDYSDAENNKAKFVNTYKTTPYTAKTSELFKVKKILGRDWNDTDTFTFTLSCVGDAPMPAPGNCIASVNKENQTAAFGGNDPLVFDTAKDYVYYIRENRGTIAGITYDTTVYKVVVTVEDDGNGQLNGTTKYYKSDKDGNFSETETAETENIATFTNTYSAASVDVTLTAHKSLDVKVGTRDLKEGEFSFELREKLADGTVSNTPITATNAADGKVTFAPLTFKDVGEKTYVISEADGKLGGITYDTNKYVVSFSITDNGDGQLKASTPVYKLNGEGEDVGGAEFVNTYTATPGDNVKFTPQATKHLTGRALQRGEFSFIVTDDENPNVVVSGGTNEDNGNITFSEIGFGPTQTAYAALLADLPTEQPTEDENPVVDGKPTDDGQTSEDEDSNKTEDPNGTEQTPENNQSTEPEQSTENNPSPEDKQPTEDEQFTANKQPDVHHQPALLALAPDDNNGGEAALPEDVQKLLTHCYTIREVKPTDAKGITYDSTVYKVCVELEDKDGKGVLTIKGEPTYYKVNGTELEKISGTPTFNNSYAAAVSDEVTVTLQKNLTGRALNAGEFTFKLSCPDDTAHDNMTATNDANGKVTFTLTYEDLNRGQSDADPTTYTYTVSEVQGDAEGVTYDDQTYTFTVKVQDDGTGKMQAKLEVPEESMTFTNTYTPKATPTPTPAATPSPKPSATPAPTATPEPVATATPAPMAYIPQTADAFPLTLLIAILAISGGALVLLIVGKKRSKK